MLFIACLYDQSSDIEVWERLLDNNLLWYQSCSRRIAKRVTDKNCYIRYFLILLERFLHKIKIIAESHAIENIYIGTPIFSTTI